MKKGVLLFLIVVFCVCVSAQARPKKKTQAVSQKPVAAERWSEEKANAWYEAQEWPVGCVFVPSNTGTPVEMWAAEYFDEGLIDRELGLAEDLGFNAIRLFMCDIVWQNDRDGFMERLEKYISLSDKHGMKLLLTFFTNGGTIKNPYLGPQPQPVPGIHNSVWMSSPGRDVVNNPEKWPIIEEYVKCIIGKYKDDSRILAWCLYNEPENTDSFKTLPFIEAVYRWAREVNPSQPLTSPIWSLPGASNSNMPIQAFVLSNSDVISFHCYSDSEVCSRHINLLKPFNRPIICSEWMARTRGSDFYTILPLFKRNKIACFSYGLVNGKQQCHYPWNSVDKNGDKIPFNEEPSVWFHDIFYPDGTPWNPDEVLFIKSMTKKTCEPKLAVVCEPYGVLSDGQEAHAWIMTNSKGGSVKVTDYGARIISICVPDRDGRMGDVIVGPDNLADFENSRPERFFGCVIGRYGNRINHASFSLDGVEYKLDANEELGEEPVICHGGHRGFDRYLWAGEMLQESNRVGVRFHRLSPDREAGFPGNCDCYVTYWLTENNTVKVEYEATTDKATVINLSNHAFFNLKGNDGGYVMDHLFQVEADECIQNNAQFCPDVILPVEGSPFDFREPHRVDYRIDMPHPHLTIMKGMSACWVIRGWDGTLRKASNLYEPRCGRGVETWTTEPALLTYTARTFNGGAGKYGPIEKFGGMLLETIHFADSPNQPRFPSTVLRPGEKYYSTTEWRFYAK